MPLSGMALRCSVLCFQSLALVSETLYIRKRAVDFWARSKIAAMKTTTYEGTVENGQIKLPETVHLPDHTKVFVVVPDMKVEPFTIATGDDGLPVIRTTNGIITSQLVKDIETLSA